MTRRQFSREFKREAVHPVVDRGVSVAQAARDLDLPRRCFEDGSSSIGIRRRKRFPGKAR